MEAEGGGGTLSEMYSISKRLLPRTRDALERLERLEYSSSSSANAIIPGASDHQSTAVRRDINQIQSLCSDMDRQWRFIAAKSQLDLWKGYRGGSDAADGASASGVQNQSLISTMKAMVATQRWYSSILGQREVKMPEIKNNEVMIKVYAIGVNRGDIIDVATSDNAVCPGLECSGIIEAVGKNVNCWKVGERVCAILEGGGYAERVAVPADFLLPLPDDIDLHDAAGLPYASSSIWLALFKMHDPGTLKNKKILIREGTCGIGALAIQYAKYMGLDVIASTGSSDKFSICHAYGAGFCVDHNSTNFVQSVCEKARFGGVDFVLDYGASDLERNIECCRTWGKVVIVDLHGPVHGRVDLSKLQKKQVEVKGYDLRFRNLVYKASVIAEVRTHLWPAVLQKKVVPVIEHRFPVIEAQKALTLLKKNDSMGKIILEMNFEVVTGHLKMD